MADLKYPEHITDYSDAADAAGNSVSYVQFKLFERIDAKTFKEPSLVSLYMPETMENPIAVAWDAQGLGLGGSKAGNGELFDSSFSEQIGQGASKLLSSMAAKLKGGSSASGEDILANETQTIVNPYLKMLFRGVNFRNFEMSFRFTPHSYKEAETIWKICQAFRHAALPDETEGAYKWKYPSEVELEYRYNGRPHPWLNRFKRCVISDCHMTYTGAGFYASMRNGFPAETQLRLMFTEIEVLTKKDIKLDAGPSY